jgi:hypothetical protein
VLLGTPEGELKKFLRVCSCCFAGFGYSWGNPPRIERAATHVDSGRSCRRVPRWACGTDGSNGTGMRGPKTKGGLP